MRRLCSSMAAVCVLWTQPIGAQGLDDLPNWRVSSSPILSIGLVDGPEPYLLYDVTSLRLTSRGQIIVANAGTRELRVFDSDGAFVRAVGRRGQGPGEYQHLTGIELFARDSLIVFDRDLRRLSVFSPSGQFLRSFLVEAPGGSAAPVEALVGVVDGKALMVGARYRDAPEYPARIGIERITNTIFSVDLTDGVVRTVTDVSGTERGYIVRESGMSFAPLPHRRWAVIAAFSGGLLVGDNALPTVRVLTPNGAFQRAFDVPFAIHQLSNDERVAWIDRMIARYPDLPPERAAEQSRTILEFGGPMVAPRYARIIPDGDGRFWVQEYHPSGNDQEIRFVGIDQDGVPFASLRIPSGLAASAEFDIPSNTRLQIDSEHVYGVWKDEQDVEFVKVYKILRN